MKRVVFAGLTLSLAVTLATTGPSPAGAQDRSGPHLNRDTFGHTPADYAIIREESPTTYLWQWKSPAPFTLDDRFGNPEAFDVPVAGDFDGDRIADPAVFRPGDPARFLVLRSAAGFLDVTFGRTGDIPLTADFDADGRIDVAVWRGGTPSIFYVRLATGGFQTIVFGDSAHGDTPFLMDFDGDGRADVGVRRPRPDDTTNWHIRLATGAYPAPIHYGLETDVYAPGDYNGDGRGDLTVVRQLANDNYRWFVLAPGVGAGVLDFGRAGDVITQGAYIVPELTDISVFRMGASFGTFFTHFAPTGQVLTTNLGVPGDTPLMAFLNCQQNLTICD